jgi:crotonobetainyl-CoA:carnitine CoA-transferase CaiB-like acyl-CoA transferase
MASALDDLRVLDLSVGVAGAYASKLLADLGASVVKVEEPSGDPVRTVGPFPGDVVDPEKSGLFLYLNAGKHGCVLDLADSASVKKLENLVASADVLVESMSAVERAERPFLSYDSLAAINPRLVVTSITPFGLSGPYRDWETEEIVEWALGGWMYHTGEPGRAPLMIPGHQSGFHAGMHAAFATLVGFYHALQTDEGQHIDVSHWESVLSHHSWLTVAWTHSGIVLRRRGADFLRCADGWIYLNRGAFYHPNLFLLIERPELAEDPRWLTHEDWIANGAELWPIVEEWTERRSKDEVVATCQELRMAVTPTNTFADLAKSAQFASREWFLDLEHPSVGRVRLPGSPYVFSDTPAGPKRPAPLLGQETEAVLSGSLWPERRTGTAGHQTLGTKEDGRGPLEGLKVIEMTGYWAGPLTGRLLADLGAEIIKVELATRTTRAAYYVGNEPGKYHYDRSGFFNQMNRNKFGISLDVSKPRGREVFFSLIRRADIFIENNSARVMRNLDLTYDVLKEVNPRLIMVSESGFGATGPERDYVAYGANIETTCALASIIGYEAGQAYRTGNNYGDPVAGTHAAVAIMAALHHRDRTGVGQYIDISLNEAAAAVLGELMMDYLLNQRVPQPRGNRHCRHAPQGCYQCAGDDMWVVLCVRSDEEWQRFCAVAGQPEWAGRSEFITVEGRRQHHDAIDELIATWTNEQDHWEAARALQAAGIPAAPVLVNWEAISNEHLFQRGFYVPVFHREAGVWPYPGFPWKFSRTPGSIRLGAPCFAEHNDKVLREILGLTDQEIQELDRQGLIETVPDQFILRAV